MKPVDLLIGASLLLAALGSALGIVTYEDDRHAGFGVTWTLRESALDAPPATLGGGGDTVLDINVAEANLTRVAWTVTIAGGPARVQPAPIRVEIVSPTNASLAEESELPAGPGSVVEIPLVFDLAPEPDAARVTGPSLEAARRALNATLSSSLGLGTWEVRVSIAPSSPGPLAGAETFTVDTHASLTSYQAALAPETPGGQRG